ncbi:MAG: hypothetical protein WC405_06230 [Syntrophales bacterium]
MDEEREDLIVRVVAKETKEATTKKNTDDMRNYKREYPDFSEALKGRRITLREC